MKKLIIYCLGLCLFAGASDAAYVRGHMRKNGTYTMGYHRTRADKNRYNNYSTRGNRNPFTGKRGTKSPTKLKLKY